MKKQQKPKGSRHEARDGWSKQTINQAPVVKRPPPPPKKKQSGS